MNASSPPDAARLQRAPAERFAAAARRSASGLALAAIVPELWFLFSPASLLGKAGWPEAVLLCAVVFATLANLTQQLPTQNVLLAGGIIGLVGGIAHGLGAVSGIPFGPFNFTDQAGPRIFGVLAWPLPGLWICAVLNSRGVARLILRPWRKLRAYGFWLIGLTAGLTLLLALALEPFASTVRHYWLWQPTKLPLTWHGAPLTAFLGWLVTGVLILAFATPSLINKMIRPRKSPPDYHPLMVWLLAIALFAAGAATKQLWSAVVFCLAAAGVVSVFALRGARW